MSCNCPGCYYLMPQREQCGWLGDTPPQPGGDRCHFVSLGQRVPEGLVIAKSLRVVRREDLAAENEAFKDLTGRLD